MLPAVEPSSERVFRPSSTCSRQKPPTESVRPGRAKSGGHVLDQLDAVAGAKPVGSGVQQGAGGSIGVDSAGDLDADAGGQGSADQRDVSQLVTQLGKARRRLDEFSARFSD